MDQRWRDGSIKETTITDPTGYYEYPTAEGGALGRWIINEQGFARFSAYPGPSVHDEHTGDVTPSCAVESPAAPANPCVPDRPGRRPAAQPAPAGGPPRDGRLGQARLPGRDAGPDRRHHLLLHHPQRVRRAVPGARRLRAGIPDVTVLPGAPRPGWAAEHRRRRGRQQVRHRPLAAAEREPGPARQRPGRARTRSPRAATRSGTSTEPTSPTSSTRRSGPNCLEVPLTGQQTKDGAFDGGYAFADYCPNGYDLAADDGTCAGGSDPVPLVAGTYITHAVMPKDSTRHARLQPRQHRRVKNVSDRARRRARRRSGLPVPHRARGGRQRRPRQPVRPADPAAARAPATTTSSTSRPWSPGASTTPATRPPAPPGRCVTSGWWCCRTARTPTPTST